VVFNCIDETDTKIVYNIAWRLMKKFDTYYLDIDELVSDGFWGLMMANKTYNSALGVPWNYWASKKIQTYMANGIKAEMNRRRILRPTLLQEIKEEEEKPAPYDLAQLIEDREKLMQITAALKDKKPVLIEAVFRTDTDTNLAKKYGYSHQSAIHGMRQRFLAKIIEKTSE